MAFFDFPYFSFQVAAGLIGLLVTGVLIIFWIFMIIDAARRNFRKGHEKIIWIVIILFFGWVGALVYFIVIKNLHPRGAL